MIITTENDSIPIDERVWRPKLRPQDIRVGKYFMLSDFLFSEAAATKGVPNCPPLEGMEVESIRHLCDRILDPVVEEFGPISLTYGYVSPELQKKTYPAFKPTVHNCKPAAGALLGAAADILVHKMVDDPRSVLYWIKANCEFDRLILFPGSSIVCVAWSDKPRSHAKEWIYPAPGEKAKYVNLK